MPKTNKPIRAAAPGSELIALSAPLSIEAADAEKKGPRTFTMRAYNGGAMSVAGYYLPVVIDLAGLTGVGRTVPILRDHDTTQVVGHGKGVKAGGALDLEGNISGTGPAAAEVLANHDNGFPWQASVGVQPVRSKIVEIDEGKTVTVNGQAVTGPCYVIRKSSLREVSVLALGADSDTWVSIAASAAQQRLEVEKMEFEQWIQAMGLTLAALSEDQQAKLKAKYDAEQAAIKAAADKAAAAKSGGAGDGSEKPVQAGAAETPETIKARRAQEAAEIKRIEAVRDICATYRSDELHAIEPKELALVEAQAVEEGWDVRDTELVLLRKARPKVPAIHASNPEINSEVIEAAICRSAGLPKLEKQFEPKVLEAADKQHRNIGLQELLLLQAGANGYRGRQKITDANLRTVMEHAFVRASGYSTVSLPGILSNVANKFLLSGFNDVEQVWREICSIRPVNDFKTVTAYRMLDDSAFTEVGPGGELEHATVSEESYTIAAKTYGRIMGLTRTHIINDDLGAFDSVRTRIGRGYGLRLNRVFWAAFLDDATFFTAARLNLITNVLGKAGLAAAELALDSMTDGNGNPIDVGGDHVLLTGATLAPTAREWYVSTEMRDTTASTKFPTSNIYANKFRPIKSRYITSATAWYLLPVQAGDMSVMEVCFLNGVETPTIESADADFNTLGIQIRAYGDFGVARKEWRASVKSAGTG